MKTPCECLVRITPNVYKSDPKCTSCKGTGYREQKARGFAAMSPERRAELGRMGGKAVQASGKGHRFTSEEAREAGRKGGTKTAMRRRLAVIQEDDNDAVLTIAS